MKGGYGPFFGKPSATQSDAFQGGPQRHAGQQGRHAGTQQGEFSVGAHVGQQQGKTR